jgi:hypothetical protein
MFTLLMTKQALEQLIDERLREIESAKRKDQALQEEAAKNAEREARAEKWRRTKNGLHSDLSTLCRDLTQEDLEFLRREVKRRAFASAQLKALSESNGANPPRDPAANAAAAQQGWNNMPDVRFMGARVFWDGATGRNFWGFR